MPEILSLLRPGNDRPVGRASGEPSGSKSRILITSNVTYYFYDIFRTPLDLIGGSGPNVVKSGHGKGLAGTGK